MQNYKKSTTLPPFHPLFNRSCTQYSKGGIDIAVREACREWENGETAPKPHDFAIL